MTSAVLHLGNNRIVLGADADLNRLRIEIDQAIRMGGGWVDVPGAPRVGVGVHLAGPTRLDRH